MRIREVRVAHERPLVSIDGLCERGAIRVELTALLEPLDRRLFGERIRRRGAARQRANLPLSGKVQHHLPIGFDPDTVVPHHDSMRAVDPGSKRSQWTVDFWNALAKRVDAAANPTQGNPAIEKRQYRSNGDEVAKLESAPLLR